MTQRGVERIYATGRRKSATARVFLSPGGTGQITVNRRTLEDYFPRESHRMLLHVPLDTTATAGQIDRVQSSADVIRDLITEYVDAADRINEALGDGE